RHKTPGAGYIDIIGDIVESANLVIRRPRTASVVLGGGTPKNFINQASVQAEFYSDEVGGHRYALQIVTDVPHFGGASGSSLEEARSWGKLATDAEQVTVQADATIALPLLVSALAGSAGAALARRNPMSFDLSGPTMAVDVHGVGIFALPEMELPFGEMEPLLDEIERVAYEIIGRDKFLVALGGEHSITPAIVSAAARKYPGLSVLQIDAHADMRDSYM